MTPVLFITRHAPTLPVLAATVVLAILAAASARAADFAADTPPVGPFTRVEVNGGATLVLEQGTQESLSVEAATKTRARIRVRNDNGRLAIDVEDERTGFGLVGAPQPRLIVRFRTLDAVDVNGAVKLEAAAIDVPTLRLSGTGASRVSIDSLKAKTLKVEGSGAFRAELAGRVTEQSISLSGAGDYRAGQLESEVANVTVSGAGKVLIRVARKLDVRVSGAGSVDYIGSPTVTQDVSGAARVRRREADAAPVPAIARNAPPVAVVARQANAAQR